MNANEKKRMLHLQNLQLLNAKLSSILCFCIRSFVCFFIFILCQSVKVYFAASSWTVILHALMANPSSAKELDLRNKVEPLIKFNELHQFVRKSVKFVLTSKSCNEFFTVEFPTVFKFFRHRVNAFTVYRYSFHRFQNMPVSCERSLSKFHILLSEYFF